MLQLCTHMGSNKLLESNRYGNAFTTLEVEMVVVSMVTKLWALVTMATTPTNNPSEMQWSKNFSTMFVQVVPKTREERYAGVSFPYHVMATRNRDHVMATRNRDNMKHMVVCLTITFGIKYSNNSCILIWFVNSNYSLEMECKSASCYMCG